GGAHAGRIPRSAFDAPVAEFSPARPGQQRGPPLDAALRRRAAAGDQAVVTAAASLSEADPSGFRSLEALGDIDHDALPLVERGQPRPLQGGGMNEHVLAAIVAHDKAEALGGVVPLYRAGLLAGGLERRSLGGPKPGPGARPRRGRSAAVDIQHLGHLRSALALRDAHFQRFARLHRGDAEPPQYRRVQKRIARTVRQLDEAEALFGLEPFDHRLNRRSSGGFFEARSAAAETRRGSKIAR